MSRKLLFMMKRIKYTLDQNEAVAVQISGLRKILNSVRNGVTVSPSHSCMKHIQSHRPIDRFVFNSFWKIK